MELIDELGPTLDTEPASHANLGPTRGILRGLASKRESGVALALIVFAALMFMGSPAFRTEYNATIILKQMTVVAILAMGQTLVMIVGAFDLSQAAICAFSAMTTALLWQDFGLDPTVAVIGGLLVGLGWGIANGVLAAVFRLHPIVMTLATGITIRGLTYFITKGEPVLGLPPEVLYLGSQDIGPVPVAVVAMFVVALVMHIMLTRTRFGRRVLQVGGNQEAARQIGVNVNRVRIGVFGISGLLAALGGIVATGRLGNASPQIGETLLFPVVTAAIIGGTLLTGGVGTMLGTLLGSAIMAMVTNALVLFQVNIFLLDTVQGVLVLVALLIDQARRGELTLGKMAGRDP